MAGGRRRRGALASAAVLLAATVPAPALAATVPAPALAATTSDNNRPAVSLVSPSPAAGQVLSTGDATFGFTYNRTSKQTRSLTCALVGPSASTGTCTSPTAAPGGASSGQAYSGLANGSYTFTATVVLTDGGTASASRQFTVNSTSCTSGLSASVPTQDGARDGQTFYGNPAPDPSSVDWWGLPVPPGLTAVISRGHDITLDANLTGGCADAAAWTYSWSYQLGDDTPAPVPGDWPGATTATLTVPKWSLQFSDVTHEDYTFTVTATPPAGSAQQPLTAGVMLRVASFDLPRPGYFPTGFTQSITPGTYSYNAFGGVPSTFSTDWPPDQQDQLGFTWYAEVWGGDEIAPVSGQGTPTVTYTWTSANYFLIRLTVCPANAPASPTNPCAYTPDFIFSTNAG